MRNRTQSLSPIINQTRTELSPIQIIVGKEAKRIVLFTTDSKKYSQPKADQCHSTITPHCPLSAGSSQSGSSPLFPKICGRAMDRGELQQGRTNLTPYAVYFFQFILCVTQSVYTGPSQRTLPPGLVVKLKQLCSAHGNVLSRPIPEWMQERRIEHSLSETRGYLQHLRTYTACPTKLLFLTLTSV